MLTLLYVPFSVIPGGSQAVKRPLSLGTDQSGAASDNDVGPAPVKPKKISLGDALAQAADARMSAQESRSEVLMTKVRLAHERKMHKMDAVPRAAAMQLQATVEAQEKRAKVVQDLLAQGASADIIRLVLG